MDNSTQQYSTNDIFAGLDIKHLIYMPIGHMVLKKLRALQKFCQYLYKPCKAYIYCWKNKYMPRLKNHLPSRACNHKSLCALGQDLHAPGCMRARLNALIWYHWCGSTRAANGTKLSEPGWLMINSLWLNDTILHQRTLVGVGGAVRFLVVGTISKEERSPQGQLWMEQCLTSLKYWPI